jgi:CDP-6-deoxy-D-xylo-4-hexulose-3-dehydrase
MQSMVEKKGEQHGSERQAAPSGNDKPRQEYLREQIRELVTQYHAAAFPKSEFVGGNTAVPVSGKVFDAEDIQHAVDASLDFWLTTGRFADQFEREFARMMGVRDARLVNSGSSANLVALSALTSPSLGDRALKPGDEVILSPPVFQQLLIQPSRTISRQSSLTFNWIPTISIVRSSSPQSQRRHVR